MTAVKTLSLNTANSEANYLVNDFAPQNRSGTGEPKTPLERYDEFCREFIEHQKQDGTPDDELITVPEIVAICKEARAERYAKKQKNSAGR